MLDVKTLPISIPYDKIVEFCKQWHVTEFALFGSVLRDDFSDNSDVDVLVIFRDGASPTLFQFVQMGDELEILFKRPVDLLTRKGVEASPNYIRRKEIRNSTQVIYAE
ncbi:MAG: nucleotidyltransferase domain-containing protein [Anaerolineae bacterium]|nr:nucleotidyltransferase domain-containing protein [Anaerolineae bacterium]MDQ7034603.1 nucleotidyltransferase domain-containing protein [Anaerolineae bacterium]